ncbi:MAG: hypothetical protein OXC40_02475, partial [Proteobacteria bacterium]|nr:hypothetical protein [Pseudomonadota bacterium]
DESLFEDSSSNNISDYQPTANNAANPRDAEPDAQGYTSVSEASAGSDEQLHPVDLQFKEANLVQVLDILSRENNINFIYNIDELQGKSVTMLLKNVSWTNALQAVLDVYDLTYVTLRGGMIKIIPTSQIVKEKTRQKTHLLIMRLSYIKADKAQAIIQTFISNNSNNSGEAAASSPTGSAGSEVISKTKITIDERTNSLVIEAPTQELSKIKTLIERLDTRTPQIKIDARIIEIANTHRDAMGINWSFPVSAETQNLGLGALPIPHMSFGSSVAVSAPADNASAADLRLQLNSFQNIPQIMMQLKWEETFLDTRVLQNTSVTVLDNETAEISSGVQDTVEHSGVNTSGTSEVSYLLSLSVKPQATIDGSVSMEVQIASDDPVDLAGRIRKATKSIKTHLLRTSGETAVIGGIYTNTAAENFKAVPYLHKIPILGMLFRNSSSQIEKKEVVILLTPTILDVEEMMGNNGGSLVSTANGYNSGDYDGANGYQYTDDYSANYPNQNAANYQANYPNQYASNQDSAEYQNTGEYNQGNYSANQAYSENEQSYESNTYSENYQSENNSYQNYENGGYDQYYDQGYGNEPSNYSAPNDADDYYDSDDYEAEDIEEY